MSRIASSQLLSVHPWSVPTVTDLHYEPEEVLGCAIEKDVTKANRCPLIEFFAFSSAEVDYSFNSCRRSEGERYVRHKVNVSAEDACDKVDIDRLGLRKVTRSKESFKLEVNCNTTKRTLS